MSQLPTVAYFSMEIALKPEIPTYSGGLGMLAGDTVRAAADRKVPMVAVSLVHRKGYSRQRLDAQGWQKDEPQAWRPEARFLEQAMRVSVELEGRTVAIRAWRYDVVGATGGAVAVLLLDTDVPENSEWDRALTDHLYGGDAHYRICQEVILGIGGIRMLRALGHVGLKRFHMNEGHAAMLVLALLDEVAAKCGRATFDRDDLDRIRKLCVFTTHTPVPAGHDQFPMELVTRVLGRPEVAEMKDVFCFQDSLNMTYLALNLSHYVNGVAKTPRGGLAPHVRQLQDRRHHQRRPCADLDLRAVPGPSSTSTSPAGARTTSACATRCRIPPRGHLDRAPGRQARADGACQAGDQRGHGSQMS